MAETRTRTGIRTKTGIGNDIQTRTRTEPRTRTRSSASGIRMNPSVLLVSDGEDTELTKKFYKCYLGSDRT